MLRVTGLCEGNSPVTGEFPTQRVSNAENLSIWWRHHDSRDIAESMMAVETEPVYKEIMKKQFNRRKIFDWSASPRPFNAAAAAPIHTLCGTMQLHNEVVLNENMHVVTFRNVQSDPFLPSPFISLSLWHAKFQHNPTGYDVRFRLKSISLWCRFNSPVQVVAT